MEVLNVGDMIHRDKVPPKNGSFVQISVGSSTLVESDPMEVLNVGELMMEVLMTMVKVLLLLVPLLIFLLVAHTLVELNQMEMWIVGELMTIVF